MHAVFYPVGREASKSPDSSSTSHSYNCFYLVPEVAPGSISETLELKNFLGEHALMGTAKSYNYYNNCKL